MNSNSVGQQNLPTNKPAVPPRTYVSKTLSNMAYSAEIGWKSTLFSDTPDLNYRHTFPNKNDGRSRSPRPFSEFTPEPTASDGFVSNIEPKPPENSYCLDLVGIDFSAGANGSLPNVKNMSSSLEDLGSSETPYPDISHAFREVRTTPYTLPHAPPQASSGYLYPSLGNAGPGYPVGSNQLGHPFNNFSTNQFTPFVDRQFSNVSTLTSASSSGYTLPRPASANEFGDISVNNLFFNNGNIGPANNVPFAVMPQPPRNGDLIELNSIPTHEEHEYLSLQSFDPLYERSRKESMSRNKIDPSDIYAYADLPQRPPPPGFHLTKSESTDLAIADLQRWSSSNIETPVSSNIGSTDHFYQSMTSSIEEPFYDNVETNLYEQLERKDDDESRQPLSCKLAKQDDIYDKLQHRVFIDPESEAFGHMVTDLKAKYPSSDHENNRGYVVSLLCDIQRAPISVKLVIYSTFLAEPFQFTCDCNILVSHIISQVLCATCETTDDVSASDYILQVYSLSEYLLNDLPLSKYEYVNNCLKLDEDIRLQLINRQQMVAPLLRMTDDDIQQLYFPKELMPKEHDERTVSRESLSILMENLYREIERLSNSALQGEMDVIKSTALRQSVMALCSLLAKVETINITKAVDKMEKLCHDISASTKCISDDSGGSLEVEKAKALDIDIRCSLMDDFQTSLEELLDAVRKLVNMYCHTFQTDFLLNVNEEVHSDMQDVTSVDDAFIVHVSTAHHIPNNWPSLYDKYLVVCNLYYGPHRLSVDVSTAVKPMSMGFYNRILFDEWLAFNSLMLCLLPRESRLCLTLVGLKKDQVGGGTVSPSQVRTALGGVSIQLFSHDGKLVQGSLLVPLKPNSSADPLVPSCTTVMPESVFLQINLPDFGKILNFPDPLPPNPSQSKGFTSLHPDIQDEIKVIMKKDPLASCSSEQLETLWAYRHYLHDNPAILPRVLQSAHGWHWACLSDIYQLLQYWSPLQPAQAFELFMPKYADSHVRAFAVDCLRRLYSDELLIYLPQLIQALKFESYHNSALARLLLEQSCKSIRFAHKMFWLLRGCAQDTTYKRRYEMMFIALVSVAGHALYREFHKQEVLVQCLSSAAESVKSAKDKETSLRQELQKIYRVLEEQGKCLLPLNPGMELCGIDLKSCSYFSSNTFPMKLVFKNTNVYADPFYTMFKVGDDLRQDMLVLQMISVMDRLWLKDGLDLKIITFDCLATGPKKGMVELVTGSETLRKIQVSHGVTGSFKDRPIKDWLQRHNPTELEYQKAVENFTRSCAGYCVATYIMGIGDRHNDNIMLKESGHLFHIDFGKFLGDSQRFGSFKRDRVPFVLTSDMLFVITDGNKQSPRYQQFVDQCCQSFNILRKNGNLLINLFSLMYRSGIPGVDDTATDYILKALLLEKSDAQASVVFTRMIEESLKSVFTQFNFFIHNLAQLKFSSHNEGGLLSFIPKTYSINTDGKILNAEVSGIQKRYSPEKHYIYIIKIVRVKQRVPAFIFRHFSEFVEFREKLVNMFSLVNWPHLPSKLVLGRSHVKVVADSRRVEIDRFLQELWNKASEICESDIVYTFFHPLLRDEQQVHPENMPIKYKEPSPPPMTQSQIQGQVKLSIQYQNDTLHVLVMHIKELPRGQELPNPYVKIYLLPDPEKQTKQKTKIIKHSTHPTFNELLDYPMSYQMAIGKTLQLTVWNHEVMANDFMGAVYINLRELDLSIETMKWYKLGNVQLSAVLGQL